jgi:predicted HAD superfamily phosphohydrolase YqeG
MEYIDFHGVYEDVPVDQIVVAWEKAYGRDRVRNWIRKLEEGNDRSLSDFAKEEVLSE